MFNIAIKFALASGLAAAMALEGSPEAAAPNATVEGRVFARPIAPPLAERTPAAPDSQATHDLAAKAFATEVIRLSREADALDRLWLVYKAECGVRVSREYAFGREWFALWDRAAQPSIDARGCSDVLWRLLQGGENVRRDLRHARAMAQAALDPGTEIGMLRWHALQWPQLEESASAR